MPLYDTYFNPFWTDSARFPDFAGWIRPVPDHPKMASCRFCLKPFALSNMGLKSIKSHSVGKKHQQKVTLAAAIPSIRTALGAEPNNQEPAAVAQALPATEPAAPVNQRTATGTLRHFVSPAAVVKAQILWCMHVVETHGSFNSSDKSVPLFQVMFPDSPIAAAMQFSEKKMRYTVCFGLARYFDELIIQRIRKASAFVVFFDESHNRVIQRGQMDLWIRFWDTEKGKTTTVYVNSSFLNGAAAEQLKLKFLEGLTSFDLKNMVQVSMDGPSVNWKMLRLLQDHLTDSFVNAPRLLDIGSCGLHVVHGAFKTGHRQAEWSIDRFLKALYLVFNDSPKKRGVFTEITGSTDFPPPFCNHRWLENLVTASNAIKNLDNIRKYVSNVKPKPTSNSFKTVEKMLEDDYLLSMLYFFKRIAGELEPFLKKYQTISPMAPYLFGSSRFVKPEVWAEVNSPQKLIQLLSEPNDSKSWMLKININIGLAAKKSLLATSTAERKSEFYLGCFRFLRGVCSKIIERSPLKYPLANSISCLCPEKIARDKPNAIRLFENIVQLLNKAGWLPLDDAETALDEFRAMVTDPAIFPRFEAFDISNDDDELDKFYFELFGSFPTMKTKTKLWSVVMLLSHGNAVVESDFSVNAQVLVENLTEESVVALRKVYDGTKQVGGPQDVEITKCMVQK